MLSSDPSSIIVTGVYCTIFMLIKLTWSCIYSDHSSVDILCHPLSSMDQLHLHVLFMLVLYTLEASTLDG